MKKPLAGVVRFASAALLCALFAPGPIPAQDLLEPCPGCVEPATHAGFDTPDFPAMQPSDAATTAGAAMYQWIGSRHPFDVRAFDIGPGAGGDATTSPALAGNWMHPLPYDRRDARNRYAAEFSEPNKWFAAALNVVFQLSAENAAALFPERPEKALQQFAESTSHFYGSAIYSHTNLESGPGLTRQDRIPATGYNRTDIIYNVANTAVASNLRGSSFFDLINTTGTTSWGTTAFHNHDEAGTDATYEEGGEGDARFRQIYTNLLTGVEAGAFVGRQISEEDSPGHLASPVFGAHQAFLEDDAWDIQPADIRQMNGLVSAVILDNKRTELKSARPVDGEPFNQGYIEEAFGVNALLLSLNPKSWLNVGQATGIRAGIYLLNDLGIFHSSRGYYGEGEHGERPGSKIRQWLAFSVAEPLTDGPCFGECGIIASKAGILVEEQEDPPTERTPERSARVGRGVSALQTAVLIEPETAARVHSPENGAALVARGSVVVGDGKANAPGGVATDVLHVNDVLHLAPRLEPPEFASEVAPSDRVGMIYFDARRGTLRVSVPAEPASGSRWQEAGIVWADVPLHVPPSSGPSGGVEPGFLSFQQARLRPRLPEPGETEDRNTNAERSLFVAPRLDVLLPPGHAHESITAVTFVASGFGGQTPRLYWRRIARAGRTSDYTAWAPIPREELVGLSDLEGLRAGEVALGLIADFFRRGAPAATPTRVSIEIMAIHPVTGQAVGASFRL